MRFGLCCLFKEEKVLFRTTTAKALSVLPRNEQLKKLSCICQHNVSSLYLALETVQLLGIELAVVRLMDDLKSRQHVAGG